MKGLPFLKDVTFWASLDCLGDSDHTNFVWCFGTSRQAQRACPQTALKNYILEKPRHFDATEQTLLISTTDIDAKFGPHPFCYAYSGYTFVSYPP